MAWPITEFPPEIQTLILGFVLADSPASGQLLRTVCSQWKEIVPRIRGADGPEGLDLCFVAAAGEGDTGILTLYHAWLFGSSDLDDLYARAIPTSIASHNDSYFLLKQWKRDYERDVDYRIAAYVGNHALMLALEDAGASDYTAALHHAVTSKSAQASRVVRHLLGKGASVTETVRWDVTEEISVTTPDVCDLDDAFDLAVQYSTPGVVRMLYETQQISVDKLYAGLRVAAFHGNLSMLRTVKTLGGDNYNEAFTACCHGCSFHKETSAACARQLISWGVKLQVAREAWSEAIVARDVAVVEMLLDRHIPVGAANAFETIINSAYPKFRSDSDGDVSLFRYSPEERKRDYFKRNEELLRFLHARYPGDVNLNRCLIACARLGKVEEMILVRDLGATDFARARTVAEEFGSTECLHVLDAWLFQAA